MQENQEINIINRCVLCNFVILNKEDCIIENICSSCYKSQLNNENGCEINDICSCCGKKKESYRNNSYFCSDCIFANTRCLTCSQIIDSKQDNPYYCLLCLSDNKQFMDNNNHIKRINKKFFDVCARCDSTTKPYPNFDTDNNYCSYFCMSHALFSKCSICKVVAVPNGTKYCYYCSIENRYCPKCDDCNKDFVTKLCLKCDPICIKCKKNTYDIKNSKNKKCDNCKPRKNTIKF